MLAGEGLIQSGTIPNTRTDEAQHAPYPTPSAAEGDSMSTRRTLRRTAAAIIIAAAAIAGPASLTHNNAPDHSVADSTWGGVAPPQPSPTPTSNPGAYAPMDSTWGG